MSQKILSPYIRPSCTVCEHRAPRLLISCDRRWDGATECPHAACKAAMCTPCADGVQSQLLDCRAVKHKATAHVLGPDDGAGPLPHKDIVAIFHAIAHSPVAYALLSLVKLV